MAQHIQPNQEVLSVARASQAIASASNAVGKAEESKHLTDDERKTRLHSIVCDLERLEMEIEDLLVDAATDQCVAQRLPDVDDDAEWIIVDAAVEIVARRGR